MNQIRFLTYAEILLIHQDQLVKFGGDTGLRDSGLLSSALAMPESSYSGNYLHETIFDMASAYLFHLCQNHPFVDGNKRVGLASALIFLDLNHIEIDDPEEKLFELTMKVATGLCKKTEIAECLKKLSDKFNQ